ncbi:hypothetical protein BJX65DRAFT_118455 [Aspergillus insuetus]
MKEARVGTLETVGVSTGVKWKSAKTPCPRANLANSFPRENEKGRITSFVFGEGLAYYLTNFKFLRTISSRVLILDCYGAVRLSWFLALAWSIPQSTSFREHCSIRLFYGEPNGFLTSFRFQIVSRKILSIIARASPHCYFGGIRSTDAHPRERRIKELSASSRVVDLRLATVASKVDDHRGVPRSHMMFQQSGDQRRVSTSTWRQALCANKIYGQYRSDVYPTTASWRI